MRIAILGDFHLNPETYSMTETAMQDIAECKPDLVVPLGDFGSKAQIGSFEGLLEAKRFLSLIGAPLRPILGNHDLQRESGCGIQPQGTIEEAFQQIFNLPASHGTLEFEHFRLFFASTNPQPAESCYQVQECFVSDNQFNWLVRELDKRRGVPVIFFTHAPPIGCGLRTVPKVHVRSTNAYLDQNHHMYRWQKLYQAYPEILFWFSAHYHLSHHYPDAHTLRDGTHFFITGVHSHYTRDNMRQSRLLDINENGIRISTIDHVAQKITTEGGFEYQGSLTALMNLGMPSQVHTNIPIRSRSSISRIAVCSFGELPAKPDSVIPISDKRFLVPTHDHFVWEIEPESEAVLGTLSLNVSLKDITRSSSSIWMAWSNKIGKVDLNDSWRFKRNEETVHALKIWEWEAEIDKIAPHPLGGIWIQSDGCIQFLDETGTLSSTSQPLSFAPGIRRMISDYDQLWILDEEGGLWHWDGLSTHASLKISNVLAFDRSAGNEAMLQLDDGQLWLDTKTESGHTRVRLPDYMLRPLLNSVSIAVLPQDQIVGIINGTAYYWSRPDAPPTALPSHEGQATAIASAAQWKRSEDLPKTLFVIARDAANEYSRPRLELWG